MDELLRLLNEFEAPEDVTALAERLSQTTGDTPVEGVEPLTAEELDTLLGALMALADDDEASVALLTEAANGAEAIRVEQARRDEEAAAEELALTEQRARLRGESTEPGEGEEPAEGEGDGAEGEPGEEEPAEGSEAREPEPVNAAGGRAARRDLARTRPPGNAPAPARREGARITVSADVPDHVPGAQLNGLGDVNNALLARYGTFRSSRSAHGGVEYLSVASIEPVYPEDRRLTDDATRNGALIDAALAEGLAAMQTQQGMAASGGFCAPLTPYYGVPVLGDARRPVQQALVGFQATRGGIISMAPPLLTDLAGSAIVWDEAMDIDAATPADDDPDIVKPCLTVVCGATRTTKMYAIPLCLKFGNFTARTFGEWNAAFSELSLIAHARLAEQTLLNQIQALSTGITATTNTISATRDVLETIARSAWGTRIRHRLPSTFPVRAILPEMLLGIMTEDLARGMLGTTAENLTVSRALIERFFTARMINVTWTPDLNVPAAQAAGALQAWPTTVKAYVYPEGTFLFLDGGRLDLGVVRDSTLNGTNDFQTFVETFEGVHKLGHESHYLQIAVCPSGAVVGTLDPADICP